MVSHQSNIYQILLQNFYDMWQKVTNLRILFLYCEFLDKTSGLWNLLSLAMTHKIKTVSGQLFLRKIAPRIITLQTIAPRIIFPEEKCPPYKFLLDDNPEIIAPEQLPQR